MARFTTKDLDLLVKGGMTIQDPYSTMQKKAAELEKGMSAPAEPPPREYIITMNLDAYELVVAGMTKHAGTSTDDGRERGEEPHRKKKTEEEITREEELGRATGAEHSPGRRGEQAPSPPPGNPARESEP